VILLTSTSDLIRVVTDAAGDIEVHASYVDKSGSGPEYNYAGKRTNTASITTATTTTVVGSPASNEERMMRHLSLFNNHASQDVVCTVEHTDGTNAEVFKEVTLAPNESLVLDGAGFWTHYDQNGGAYVGTGPFATQAQMEGGLSLTTVVSPGVVQFHPSAAKAWGKAVGAGTSLTVNYNISSIGDTGTGRLQVNIGTDMSTANYSILAQIERGVTTLGVADVEQCAMRLNSPATTGFEIESYDHTATTLAADDPQNYFWACFGDQ
jgi:hypothetical protein